MANALRLLRLPTPVRDLVSDGALSMGHARAILGLETAAEMESVARNVAGGELSVRQTEALVRKHRATSSGQSDEKDTKPASVPSSTIRDLEARLQRSLGTRVKVTDKGEGKGRIELHFHSLDALDGLLDRLLGQNREEREHQRPPAAP